jgi:hypothetical protein
VEKALLVAAHKLAGRLAQLRATCSASLASAQIRHRVAHALLAPYLERFLHQAITLFFHRRQALNPVLSLLAPLI